MRVLGCGHVRSLGVRAVRQLSGGNFPGRLAREGRVGAVRIEVWPTVHDGQDRVADLDAGTGVDDGRGRATGEDHEVLDVDAVVDVGPRGEIRDDLVRRGDNARHVPTLVVHTQDRDLDHALPEAALGGRGVVPDVLETLMRLEVALVVPEAMGGGEGVLDRGVVVVLCQRCDVGVVRERPPRAVTGSGVLRTTQDVAIALVGGHEEPRGVVGDGRTTRQRRWSGAAPMRMPGFARPKRRIALLKRLLDTPGMKFVVRLALHPPATRSLIQPPIGAAPYGVGSIRDQATHVPELPEVESVRRQLAPELVGRTITDVWWDSHPAHRFTDVGRATGRRIEDVRRRGKFLILDLDNEPGEPAPADVAADTADDDREAAGRRRSAEPDLELILHLGMTGSFRFTPYDPDRTEADDAIDHVRARFFLDDGRELRFRDPRRFGRVSVVLAGEYADEIPTLATLGPEPLSEDFTAAGFAADLARTTSTVKAALLGQRLVAGVGNIYTDESLWRAKIHPTSRRVGRERAHRLHGHIREVIAGAIDREGTTFRDYQMVNGESGRNADFLDAYGQGGLPCHRCGTTMRFTTVAQRGTTYCPSCQRA